MGFYTNKTYSPNDSIKKFEEQVSDLLRSYTYLIIIDVNKLNDIIEYQIKAYSPYSIEKTKNSNFPNTDIFSPLYSSSFIINLSKDDYRQLIKSEIQKIFPETNLSPIAQYRINNQVYSSDNTFYVGLGDTLNIDASYSEDVDSDRRLLMCFWSQSPPMISLNISPDSILPLSTGSFEQRLRINYIGNYQIKFYVSDGVSISKELKITIICKPKPLLLLNQNHDNFFYFKSIYRELKGQKKSISVNLLASTIPPVNSRLYAEVFQDEKDSTVYGKMDLLKAEIWPGEFSNQSILNPVAISATPYSNGYLINVITSYSGLSKTKIKIYTMSDQIRSNDVVMTHNYYFRGFAHWVSHINTSNHYFLSTHQSGDSIPFYIKQRPFVSHYIELTLINRFSIGIGGDMSSEIERKYLERTYIMKNNLDLNISYVFPLTFPKRSNIEPNKIPHLFIVLTLKSKKFEIEEKYNAPVFTNNTIKKYPTLYTFHLGLNYKPFMKYPIYLDVDIGTPSLNNPKTTPYGLQKINFTNRIGLRFAFQEKM
ncbi:MAG: hypothetical protein NW218_00790 [Saprospiraceae bacterium]|nr:hypothetical protein [Saprospiraceae bacterium]